MTEACVEGTVVVLSDRLLGVDRKFCFDRQHCYILQVGIVGKLLAEPVDLELERWHKVSTLSTKTS